MHLFPRALRVLVAVLASASVWIAAAGMGTRADASTIPPTALSQSTGIDPMLLEQVQLLYRFPQMALADSQASAGPHFTGLPFASGLFATTPGETSSSGLGVLARGRSVAVFALTQPTYVINVSRFGSTNHTGQIVQAGAGMRTGGVRFGAALRGTRSRQQDGTEDRTPRAPQVQSSETVLDYLEAGLGCGADIGRTRVELEVDLPHRVSKTAGLQISSSDTLGARLQTYPHQAWNLVGRVSRPLGARAHVVAAATYEHGDLEWAGQVYTSNATRDTSQTQKLESWSAAVSIATTTSYLDIVAVSAAFSRRQLPDATFDQNTGFVRANRDEEDGTLTLAVARRLWRDVTLYANVNAHYTHDKFESVFARSQIDAPHFERNASESVTQDFGYGAAYAYKRFRFFAAVRNLPSVSSPIETLDLQIGF